MQLNNIDLERQSMRKSIIIFLQQFIKMILFGSFVSWKINKSEVFAIIGPKENPTEAGILMYN